MKSAPSLKLFLARAAAAVSQPAFLPIISTNVTLFKSYTFESLTTSEIHVAIYFAALPYPGV